MPVSRLRMVFLAGVLLVCALLVPATLRTSGAAIGPVDLTPTVYAYLPLLANEPAYGCPTSSDNQYAGGPAFQYDLDDYE